MITLKRGAVLAAPAAVTASMALVFRWLSHRLRPQAAYNAGFIIYWLTGCLGFPMAVLGRRRAARLLTQGRRPSGVETLLLILPAAGAVTSELLPNRNKIDGAPAAVMATTGLINSAGEELLWRGVFLQEFPHDLLRGRPWPLVGFFLWHLVPQMILPSRLGRRRFMLGAGLIGSVSAFSAWRSGGLRNCLSGFSLSDRFVRSNCRSVSLRSHMIENVLEIAAPAEKVFDFIVDVRNEPQWNPQMLHAEMLTPEPIGVGTTFRVRFGRGVGDGLIRDTKINRPRSWAAISRSRALDAESTGEMNDITGGCRLIMRTELRPHGILRLLTPASRWWMRRALDQDLQRMKGVVDDRALTANEGEATQTASIVRVALPDLCALRAESAQHR